MIILENVSKFILSDISIHIPVGKCIGLIGVSGAGKTTLLKLISGMLAADEGYVRVLGHNPVKRKGSYGREVAIMFTGLSNLERNDTVLKNLEMLSLVYGIPKQEFHKEYEILSKRLDFEAYQNVVVNQLSLGQRMRVELAAALMISPKLLLLDEPDVGLDENGKAALWELLEERKREGMTIVLSSHNLGEISKYCDRIALLEKGKLLFYGTQQRLQSLYAPIDTMQLKLSGNVPDLEDLPLIRYEITNDSLKLAYNSNYLSAAEIIKLILKQTQIGEVQIIKPSLTDIIMQLKGEGEDELN